MKDQLSLSGKVQSEARRNLMLQGPILSTICKLALPTIVVLVVQTLVSIAETYFVSFLGTEVLAGVALVFPILLLMTTMSNGGIGGGVSSAVARSLGKGLDNDANKLTLHALILAVGFGLMFTFFSFALGPICYQALGGSGENLKVAITYSNVIFAGAIPVWCVNLLSSALRGAGNVRVPALIILGGAIILIPLSPILIFGFGPIPGLGVVGAGLAINLYYLLALGILVRYLIKSGAGVQLRFSKLEGKYFVDILKVGGLSALGTIQANLTLLAVTGAVGIFGTKALAAYGLASRIDSLLIPVLFGLGTAVLSMVGINFGAGNYKRAEKITWTGGILALAFGTFIAILSFTTPESWIHLFTNDLEVVQVGTTYLRFVAPSYPFFSLGLLLYFASQGYGSVKMSFLAGSIRLVTAAGGGWIVVKCFGLGIDGLFLLISFASLFFGGFNAFFTRSYFRKLLRTS